VEKQITITFSDPEFVALVIRQAMCMRRIILPPVSCLDVLYFSTIFNKLHDFRTKAIAHKMNVLIFSTAFV
jgi:hypothetical protein